MDTKLIQRSVVLGTSIAAGVGAGIYIRGHYATTDEQAKAKADGKSINSAADVIAKIAPVLTGFAGAIGAGCMRAQTSTPGGISTALLAAGAISTGIGASALVNSNGNSENYLTALGVMSTAALGGFVLGRYTHQKGQWSAFAGLGALGVGTGMVVPWAMKNYASGF